MHGHVHFWHAGNRDANLWISQFNGQGRRAFARVKAARKKDAQGYGG